MASLQLSYDELSPRLKHCLLSFSVYPEDYEISIDQLACWWVGEGFVDEMVNAFNCLTELISRCLVEVVKKRKYDGRVYICKVHDMVRELAIKIARDEAFCSFDDKSVQIPTAESRRLGITPEMTNFCDLRGNSKLRALLLMKKHSIPFKKGNPLAKVTTLRVLDLSHLKLDDNVCVKDLWNWICSLKRLGYLNLRGVTELESLHDSIIKLWGLQTLILEGCTKLRKLPTSIGNLFRLKVLDVGNCKELSFLPKLSKLVELQELYGFKIPSSSDTEGCQFGELGCLTKLRVLHVDIKQESIIKEEDLSVLQHHDKLKILTINANNLEDKELLEKIDQLSPPENLEEVYLKGYNGHSIPKWVNPTSLPKVEYLCLEEFKSANVVNPEFWGDANTKWNVEGLCMKYLINLPMKWETLKSAMPSLDFLEVGHCYKFQDFECDVERFDTWRQKKVEEPEIIDCPEEENMAPKEEEKPEVIDCKDEEDHTVLMDI